MEEVFGSGDACYISQYFYLDGKDASGKVYAGPVWDFDHSIGSQAGWQLQYPNSLYANRLQVKDGFDSPWFYSLYHKEAFYEALTDVYEHTVLPTMEQLKEMITAYADRIEQAAYLNQVRWGQPVTSAEQTVSDLCDYMSRRTDFLSRLWLEDTPHLTTFIFPVLYLLRTGNDCFAVSCSLIHDSCILGTAVCRLYPFSVHARVYRNRISRYSNLCGFGDG